MRVEEGFPVWVFGCAVDFELGDNALQLVSGLAFVAFLENSQQPPLLARTLVFPAIRAKLSLNRLQPVLLPRRVDFVPSHGPANRSLGELEATPLHLRIEAFPGSHAGLRVNDTTEPVSPMQ